MTPGTHIKCKVTSELQIHCQPQAVTGHLDCILSTLKLWFEQLGRRYVPWVPEHFLLLLEWHAVSQWGLCTTVNACVCTYCPPNWLYLPGHMPSEGTVSVGVWKESKFNPHYGHSSRCSTVFYPGFVSTHRQHAPCYWAVFKEVLFICKCQSSKQFLVNYFNVTFVVFRCDCCYFFPSCILFQNVV